MADSDFLFIAMAVIAVRYPGLTYIIWAINFYITKCITMKSIEIDEDLYRYIAGRTQHISESASDILRRMLKLHHGVN